MTYATLQLKKHEDRRLQRGHLWIFSNEIDVQKTPLKSFQTGELVHIESADQQSLGIGYINPNTLLCARLLTRHRDEPIDVEFFKRRFSQALRLRERLFHQPYYRLIYSEGDDLPGLVVDRYGEIFVVQLNTAGMENLKSLVIDALVQLFSPAGILYRNTSSGRQLESLPSYVEVAYGTVPQAITLAEHQVQFEIPLWAGQKTGWFYDQCSNRSRLPAYVNKARVLDICSYIGAWGVAAAYQGAKAVLCVDSSAEALNHVQHNAALNRVESTVKTQRADVFDLLPELVLQKEQFDVIVLDPPALIKRKKDLKAGMQAYIKLNKCALQLLSPQGILISTSCSMQITRDIFFSVLHEAGVKAKRSFKVIEQLQQAPDHPIHPAIVETNYLKGYICACNEG
ncbi:MAG: SAM-dependent methyltransferase [Gammaproteobacteria bacterium GWE2_42_36]|nr:MAG: SAM-dependent methyltransferase [Gammaproteobacteria bacterium GWE2_42_36]HCU04800.1 RlmI/RlmK family 23S rRNA methyltransferase [Coxiellaceae bacterium]